jgi:hypothetical protein
LRERDIERERERERKGMNVLGSYVWGVFLFFKCFLLLLI